MIIRIKYFYDILNIAMIIAPDRVILSAKCAQIPLTFAK